jgi:hypothetical protein
MVNQFEANNSKSIDDALMDNNIVTCPSLALEIRRKITTVYTLHTGIKYVEVGNITAVRTF